MRERGVGGFVRRNINTFRMAAAPVLLIGLFVSIFKLLPDPTIMPEPKLLFISSKHYATPIRLINLLARRPKKLAAVALANKMARILWAMMVSGEVYRRPQQA